MSEVEKMYENCNIKPKQKGYCDWDSNCPYPHHKCNDECPYWKHENEAKYPPFTAEKQLSLIKWLMNKSFSYSTVEDKDGVKYWFEIDYETSSRGFKSFEETIADTINEMWQDLTEEEKAQIKNILEG